MAMEISKTFVVRAPVDAAWDFLIDPARVASCLPGAAVTERVDDVTFLGTITVKVGPVSASYRGTMRFARLDPAAHAAEIVASGSDTRGKGGAEMLMNSRLVATGPGETEVTVISQVNVMGVLAQFGRGMIQDVSDQLFQRFVTAMREQLEGTPSPGRERAAPADARGASGQSGGRPAASSVSLATPVSRETPAAARPERAGPAAALPIQVLSFGPAVLGRAAVRAARRPAVWFGAALVGAVVVWWFARRPARAGKEGSR